MSTVDSTPNSNNPQPLTSAQNLSLSAYLRGYVRRLTSGDLGSLPIIVGMIVIALIFQRANSNFLTPRNFGNLILQMAGTTMIAYGVVFVLLGAITDSLYALTAGSAARWLRGKPRFLTTERWVSGGLYIGLGVVAALSSGHRK